MIYVVKKISCIEETDVDSNVYLFNNKSDAIKKVNELYQELKNDIIENTDIEYFNHLEKIKYMGDIYLFKNAESISYKNEDMTFDVSIEEVNY